MWWTFFACAPEADLAEVADSPALVVSDLTVVAERVTCDDPAARAEGPMVRYEAGADWANQASGDAVVTTGWGITVADLDGNGALDVFLPQTAQDEIFFGNGDGTLRAEPFPGETDPGIGATAADPDGDGDLDLYVAVDGQDRFYRNDAGAFIEVGEAIGLVRESWYGVGAAFGDMDGDGDLDLVVTNYYAPAEHEAEAAEDIWRGDGNQLYENLGDGTFAPVDAPVSSAFTEGFTYAIGWVDTDVDGDLDLYVVNDKGDDIVGNTLLRNDGGAFTDIGPETFTDIRLQGMGLGVGDLNGDGLPELAVTGQEEIALLESLPDGTWFDAAAARGVGFSRESGRGWGWAVELADLDNDTHLDLYAEMGVDELLPGETENADSDLRAEPAEPAALWLQDGEGHFTESSEPWGLAEPRVGRGLAVVDYNRDGWLDLVRRDLHGQAELMVSRCGNAASFAVTLREAAGLNRFAVGARVAVTVGDAVIERVVTAGGTSMASSAPTTLHFGLGDATQVDRIAVRWPDGAVSTLGAYTVGQHLAITRE